VSNIDKLRAVASENTRQRRQLLLRQSISNCTVFRVFLRKPALN
jgi:hypothetical protein